MPNASAPAAPVVTVQPESVTETAFTVQWPEPDNGGSSIISYKGYLAVDGDELAYLGEAGVLEAWEFGGLDPSTTYRVGIIAVNAVGDSEMGEVVVTTADVVVPQAPAAPVVTIQSGSVTETSFAVEWPDPDDGGSPITAYKVYLSPEGEELQIHSNLAVVNEYTFNSVQSGTTYSAGIAAINEVGESPIGEVTVTTLGDPPPLPPGSFNPQPRDPEAPLRYMLCRLWNSDMTEIIDVPGVLDGGIITDARQIHFDEQVNAIGGGSFIIDRDSPQREHLIGGRIVQTLMWNVDRLGEPTENEYVGAYLWRIEIKDDTLIARVASEKIVTIDGHGIAQDFEVSAVDPYGGPGRVPWGDLRHFGWQAPELVDDDWTTPFRRARVSDRTASQPNGLQGEPITWPVPLQPWLWGTEPNLEQFGDPPGVNYFRYKFTAPQDMWITIYVSADNLFILAFDGVEVMSFEQVPGEAFKETYYRRMPIKAGDHWICARVENLPQEEIREGLPEALNPGLFTCAVMQDIAPITATPYLLPVPPADWGGVQMTRWTMVTTSDTAADLALLTAAGWDLPDWLEDFGPWKCLAYPLQAPGMTPGRIIKILLQEAQNRGELPGWTITWDEFTDGNQNPWPEIVPDFNVRVGTSFYDVLMMLVDQGYIDWFVSKIDMALYVFAAGSTGHATRTTQFREGVQIRSLSHTDRWGMGRDKMLARTVDGWVRQGTGPRQAVISVPDMRDKDKIAAYLQTQINRTQNDQSNMTLDFVPVAAADLPVVGYRLLESVSLPGVDGDPRFEQVTSMDVTEQVVGPPSCRVEVLTPRVAAEQRIIKVQDRMSPGSFNGRVASVAPATKSQPQQQVLRSYTPGFTLPDAAKDAQENAISNGLRFSDSPDESPPGRVQFLAASLSATSQAEEPVPAGRTIVRLMVNGRLHGRYGLESGVFEYTDYWGSNDITYGVGAPGVYNVPGVLPNVYAEFGPNDKFRVELEEAGDHRGLRLELLCVEVPS